MSEMQTAGGSERIVLALGVSRDYGKRRVLGPIDLEMNAGIIGLLGPNGAGKTTLLRCLTAGLEPSSGNLEVLGSNPAERSGRTAIRGQVGYLPQNPEFYPNFTVAEMLAYFCALKRVDGRSRRESEIERVLEAVGLTAQRRVKIRRLSGGMRQRVGIAQALLGTPRLIVMDEPTVGLDPEQRWQFRTALAGAAERGAVILSSHDIDEAALVASRLLVMAAGRIIFDGSPRDLGGFASGKVWISDSEPKDVRWWRSATGEFRSVGDRPNGGQPADPTCEDGYLLLLAEQGCSA